MLALVVFAACSQPGNGPTTDVPAADAVTPTVPATRLHVPGSRFDRPYYVELGYVCDGDHPWEQCTKKTPTFRSEVGVCVSDGTGEEFLESVKFDFSNTNDAFELARTRHQLMLDAGFKPSAVAMGPDSYSCSTSGWGCTIVNQYRDRITATVLTTPGVAAFVHYASRQDMREGGQVLVYELNTVVFAPLDTVCLPL